VIACAALVAVFVTGNLAQGPAPIPESAGGGGMGPGMSPGMPGGGMPGMPGGEMGMGMGMMPGGGGGAGGSAMQPQDIPAPEHLLMTYDEFLAKEGVGRVPIPKAYMLDDAGKPKRLSANEWYQLNRIYQEGVVEAKGERGRVGADMAEQVRAEVDHIQREHAAIRELYEWAVNHCFSAKISQPVLETVRASSADNATVRLHVVVQSTKDFPTRAAKRLQPLSVMGTPWRDSESPGARIGSAAGRARLDIVTREGGFVKPVKLYLDAEGIGLWNQLWSDTDLRVSLLDTGAKKIGEQTLGAGLDGGICQQMIYPIQCWPTRTVHQMPDVSPWGTKLKLLNGASADMYDLKGWLIGGTGGLTFSLPVGTLATLDGVQVDLLPAEGLKEVLLKKIGG
jgi:hypothetical protein